MFHFTVYHLLLSHFVPSCCYSVSQPLSVESLTLKEWRRCSECSQLVAHSDGFSLLPVFGKPARVGPPPFSLISGRAYTRPDVPREFYPRRSAKSTHFPHLPDMRHLRGERAKKPARRSAVDFYTFPCFGSSGFDSGTTLLHDAGAETDNNRL